jgi:hypothetical protein
LVANPPDVAELSRISVFGCGGGLGGALVSGAALFDAVLPAVLFGAPLLVFGAAVLFGKAVVLDGVGTEPLG